MITRELAIRLFTLVWLVAVWVLLWGTAQPGTIVAGLLVALLVSFGLPLPRVPVEGKLHPLSLAWLVVLGAYEMVKSSVVVGVQALKPGRVPATAIIEYRFSVKSDLSIALMVDITNNIPGSMVLELDLNRRVGYIHVFNAAEGDELDAFRRGLERMERQFIRAFERPEDWRPATNGGAA